MSSALKCPNCQALIEPSDLACRSCGADIALLLLAADRAWLAQPPGASHTQPPLSTEQLVPRLGDYLVQKGYINAEQLRSALAQQTQAEADIVQRRLLGQTLVDLGFLTSRGMDEAIARRLLDLQSELLEANASLERRVAERTAQLETALTRLTEYNQLKANFVANVSHELRTPLTHIKGYNVLMLEGALGTLTQEQREALKVTATAIGRLEQHINDLISYAAAARGELVVNALPLRLQALAAQVIARSEENAQRRQVSLEAALPPDGVDVLADEEKLHWTLLQLIDNAVKFTPAGGRVVLSAEMHGSSVVLSVSDTGIGIPPDQLEDIFEPFRQLDGSSTRRYPGTGLGLALVRRIVEAHGARMIVASQENHGSTFSFALPCSRT